MLRCFVKADQIKDNNITIKGQDVRHIKEVLRKQLNDNIEVGNKETGEIYLCKIQSFESKHVLCDIIKKINDNHESNIYIHVFQGLPKSDKMELIIQKSVELGASEITPVQMKRSVVKIHPKEEMRKIQRWQRIAEAAAKQAKRNKIPIINEIIKAEMICKKCKDYDAILIAYEKEKNNKLKNELEKLNKINKKNKKIAIIIGPEGGFEESEVQYLDQEGGTIITLGNRVLRTETVALNMISNIMYELEG